MQNILVFGTGKLYKEKEGYIKAHFNIMGFLDNKVSGSNVVYEGTDIPVYNPENIGEYMQEDTMVVLMSYQYPAMWKQLCRLNVKKTKFCLGFCFRLYQKQKRHYLKKKIS